MMNDIEFKYVYILEPVYFSILPLVNSAAGYEGDMMHYCLIFYSS